MAPYRLFRSHGERFVYFPDRDCSFVLDEPTYVFLEHAREMSSANAAKRLLADGVCNAATASGILAEAKKLENAGLFHRPCNELPDEVKERALTHRYSTPWTRLELALAETCNLACKYCYCSTVRDMPSSGLMTQDVAQRAIDWLFHAAGDATELAIVLFGGEPLLNKPVFKFVVDYSDALAREHHKKIHYVMTTNGTLIDDMVVRYIKKHNFGLMVSMDGPPEIHNAQCPTKDGGPSFDLAAQGIKRLMRRRKRVTVRCTMTNARPRMKELVEFFNEFGFTRVVLGRACNPVRASEVDCGPDTLAAFEAQENEELIPWMLGELAEGRIPIWFPYLHAVASPEPDPEKPKPLSLFRCGACRGTTTVGADGRLYPCHRFVGMRNFVMGHIYQGPDIEYAKAFWRRYDAAVDAKCAKCWARRACNRPCPWEIAREDGSFVDPNDDCCSRTRHSIEQGIYMRYHIRRQFPDVLRMLENDRVDTDDKQARSAPKVGADSESTG